MLTSAVNTVEEGGSDVKRRILLVLAFVASQLTLTVGQALADYKFPWPIPGGG
jgi:hypothetical protein